MGNSNSSSSNTKLNNTLMNDIMIKTEKKLTVNVKSSFKGECGTNITQTNVVTCLSQGDGGRIEQSNTLDSTVECAFASMNNEEISTKMVEALTQSVVDSLDTTTLLEAVNEQKNAFFGWGSNKNSTTNNTDITNSLKNNFENEVKTSITKNVNATVVGSAKTKLAQRNSLECATQGKNSVVSQSNSLSSLLSLVVTQDVIGQIHDDFMKTTKLDLRKKTKVKAETKSDNKQANLGPEMLCASYSCFVCIMAIIILVCVMIAMGAMGGSNSG